MYNKGVRGDKMFTQFFYTLRIALALVSFIVSISACMMRQYDLASYLVGFAIFALLIGDYIGPVPTIHDDEDDDYENRI